MTASSSSPHDPARHSPPAFFRSHFPRLQSALSRAREFVLDVLYPEQALCLACGAVVRSGCLCDVCRDSLRRDDFFRSWEHRDLNGVSAFSLRPHHGIPRSLVLALKHQAAACAAEELAELILPLPGFFTLPPSTVVTWVPMPARRRRERCIDHGRVLAEAIARRLNLPVRPLLRRQNDLARPQASLNRAAREQNLRKAYSPAGKIDSPVLLIDDVLTTGTTALRCIDALRKGGAQSITVLTITYATNN